MRVEANDLPVAHLEDAGETRIKRFSVSRTAAPVSQDNNVVTGIDHSKRRVTLDCKCRVGDRVVLEGEALVLAPSRKFD